MSRIEPTRDVFDILIREHDDLLALLWDVEAAHRHGDARMAGDLFLELAEALWAHESAEAAIVHPAVPDLRAVARADELVEHIGTLDPADPVWGERVGELGERLYAQFQAEERRFVVASGDLEPGQSLALGAAYDRLHRLLVEDAATEIIELDDEIIELDDELLAALTVTAA